MEQLQTTFYIMAIIYMTLNVLILAGIGIGIYFIIKTIVDLRKQVMVKVKAIENALDHPDEVIANVGMSIAKAGLRNAKRFFNRVRTEDSS